MEDYLYKRATGGIAFSRRDFAVAPGDAKREDRTIRCCNRLGCSTSPNYMKATNSCGTAIPRNAKSKAIAGSSNGSFSSGNIRKSELRRSLFEQQGRISTRNPSIVEVSDKREGREYPESSIPQDEPDISDSYSQPARPDPSNFDPTQVSSNMNNGVSATFGAASSSKLPKQSSRASVSGNRDAPSSSSARRFVCPKNSGQSRLANPQSTMAGGPPPRRYGLRNCSCASTSDVSSVCSTDGVHNKRIEAARKRPAAESSLARGKATVGSSSGGYSISGSSISISESSTPEHALSRSKSRLVIKDSAVSNRTNLGSSSAPQSRLSVQRDDTIRQLPETAIPRLTPSRATVSGGVTESSVRSARMEPRHGLRHLYRQPALSNRTARNRSTSSSEDISTRNIDFAMDSGGTGYRGLGGIHEVLLALERIEQDEEFAYERLLALEANLFVDCQILYDRHRDMRMDIDNMTYEQLLALGDQIGTVSTALSEEAISKSLERSTYICVSPVPGSTACCDADVKCSICQEEYASGDELGRLACQHKYHVACVYQWLRMKNWCPICKASVAPA